jgi:hypothetical protein
MMAVAAAAAAVAVAVVEEVISEVMSQLQQRPEEWYHEGIQALTSQGHKAIDLGEGYIEK